MDCKRVIAVLGQIFASAAVSTAVMAQPADGPPGAIPVTAVQAQKRDVPVYARGIGTVQAWRSVLVRSRVDGTLDRLGFHEGQEVHPGDLLAQIDPRPYAATLAQARAHRAADAALLENARRDLARYEKLVKTNVASRQQADTQASLVSQYQANIEADEAAIALAALNLSFCSVTAPIEGVTGFRLADPGNLIHATDSAGIVSIAQVHPIALVFTLPQDTLPALRDAMRLQDGKPPVVAFTSDNHVRLSEGRLVTINNEIDTQTGTISIKAEFANTDNSLWPGQFVGAQVRLGIISNAVTVPAAAVQHGADGLYVYVVKPDHTVARQTVSLGYQDETASVVTDGLAGGETVVLSGQLRLQPGSLVTVQPKDAS